MANALALAFSPCRLLSWAGNSSTQAPASRGKLKSSFVSTLGGQFTCSGNAIGIHKWKMKPVTCMAWKGALASIRLTVQGMNMELTDAVKAHVEEKVGNAVQHYAQLVRQVDVRISARLGQAMRGPQLLRCEVTVFTKKHGVVRAEEETNHMYTSIDRVSNIIGRKLHKIKEKDGGYGRSAKARHIPRLGQMLSDKILDLDSLLQKEHNDLSDEIVRVKYFEMPPMSIDQALELLNNVGHDFYAFRNKETGEINILYKRRHGGYGLIVPRHSLSGNAENGSAM